MRQTRITVSKRGDVQLHALVGGVWNGIILDRDDAEGLAEDLARALAKTGRAEE